MTKAKVNLRYFMDTGTSRDVVSVKVPDLVLFRRINMEALSKGRLREIPKPTAMALARKCLQPVKEWVKPPKTHWLYGSGPDRRLDFKVEIDEETRCCRCFHSDVCDYSMEKRCSNYSCGSSVGDGCQSCSHRFTRYDKDPVPCFICPFFNVMAKPVKEGS